MKIISDNADLPLDQKAAVSIGNFDGIHAGHRALVSVLVSEARKNNIPSLVVTFDPHPIEILVPGQRIPRLTTIERKGELLANCGVDYLVVLPTGKELLQLDYRQFFQQYVNETYRAQVVVEGPNFFFGRNREGTTDRLKSLCADENIALSIVEISETNQGVTSSTGIRNLILKGDMHQANQLLVDNYQIQGRVTSGASRGRKIGFPTANLSEIDVLIPAEGVYAGWTRLEGEVVPSAIHIGPNPTFDDKDRKVEVHLMDKQVDLYEVHLKVEFVSRVREIRKFANQQELILQIEKDLEDIRSLLSQSQC